MRAGYACSWKQKFRGQRPRLLYLDNRIEFSLKRQNGRSGEWWLIADRHFQHDWVPPFMQIYPNLGLRNPHSRPFDDNPFIKFPSPVESCSRKKGSSDQRTLSTLLVQLAKPSSDKTSVRASLSGMPCYPACVGVAYFITMHHTLAYPSSMGYLHTPWSRDEFQK